MTLEEFVVKIGFTTNPQGLNAIEKKVVGVAERSKSAFSGLMGMVGKLAAGYSVFQIGKYAVQSAAQLERLQAQFEVMLGSAGAASRMISDIQKLAAATPLESMGITESVKTLIQFGVAGDKAVDTVRMLGDVAGGDQNRLSSLALAFGQVVAAGRLTGQDMLQFVNTGFNPLKVMLENADKFGLKAGMTMSQLRDDMSKGKVSADMVARAFEIATSKGGMFYQNMTKQSKTLGGLWSTMVDNIQLTLVRAMQPVLPLLKQLIDWVGQIDWGPVERGIMMAVAAVKLFGRALVEFGILDALWIIGDAISTLFGAYSSPATWADAIRAAALVVSHAFWIIAGAITMVTDMIDTLMNHFWLAIPIITKLGSAWLLALGPMGLALAALGSIYFAYVRISEAARRATKEEEYHSAMVQQSAAASEHATLMQEKAKYAAFAKTGVWTGSPMDRPVSREAAAETARRLDPMVDIAKKKRDSANELLGEFSKEDTGANADKFTAEINKIIQGVAKQDFNAMAQQQLQNINNNQKKVTNNITNQITIPTTVNDKGETPLSIAAVRSVADTAIRSALNVRLLSVLEGV